MGFASCAPFTACLPPFTPTARMPLKIASWNVNSLNVRLPHLEQWLQDAAPDVVGLQETKLEDNRFPDAALAGLAKAYLAYCDCKRAGATRTIAAVMTNGDADNVFVGRNGMHKYNNQDHSMFTAMLTVDNIVDDAGHDIWEVNVEEEYHEEKGGSAGSGTSSRGGTGRDAPIIPSTAPRVGQN